MGIHVKGFKPPDERWEEMKQVYDSCKKAEIEVPEEVNDFFNGEEPDEAGVEVNIKTSEYTEEMVEGFDVNIKDIPDDVQILRFYYVY